jgi:hypothetical protein
MGRMADQPYWHNMARHATELRKMQARGMPVGPGGLPVWPGGLEALCGLPVEPVWPGALPVGHCGACLWGLGAPLMEEHP